MSRVHDALRRLEHPEAIALSTAGLNSEHWLLTFVEELLAQLRASGELHFENVQGLLQQHEQVFLKDLETARRMYRTYPRLFQPERQSDQSKVAQA
ncbi:MAG TPA: hypothetical protein VNV82_07205 [Bryobacteraceae bacterium]|jgi:hypothetical protein|nr:hypothetical protein [Bryobacteraceae bacterium]